MAQISDKQDKQTADVVIFEARRIKEILAEAMGFDLQRILDDARQKQEMSGRKIVHPPDRPNS